MSLQYRIYGLTISSDVELPELALLAGPADAPDVLVTLCETKKIEEPSEWFREFLLPTGERFPGCAKIDGGYLLRFEGMADFAVTSDGRRITCARKEPRLTPLTVRHLLLDQAFPLVLNLLGRETLHATAVLTPRGACAFVGPGGAGKSTLAASFLFAGFPVMSDDCLVVEERDRVFATPAYPGLRLWMDTFEAFSSGSDQPIPVAEYTSKARLLGRRALANFPGEPHPLVRIYRVLRMNGAQEKTASCVPRVAPTTARESFVELLSSAWPFDITDRAMLARQFRFFGRLAKGVPVKQLLVPNGFSSLSAVRQAVLTDLDNE